MKNTLSLLTTAIIFLFFGCSSDKQQVSIVDYVDPHIGTVGHLLQPTRPNVQLPNQMIRMHPIRTDYLDDQIDFFPLTMSSHRHPPLFGILPGTGNPGSGTWNARQTYDHDLEIVKPFFYSTYLIDEEITTEFVPGNKTGMFRFFFPAGEEKRLRIHTNHTGKWNLLSKTTISGIEEFEGMTAYVFGEFNFDAKTELTEEGQKAILWAEFPNENPEVFFKYGISFISIEQAKQNLDNEIAGWDFEKMVENGKKIWEDALSKIQITGGTEAQKRTFYTSLYRTYERMININEDGKYYSAYDHKVHESDRDFYVDDWVWDSYLTHHPLRMIIDSKKEADMLSSYVKMYEQSGWMPQFPLLFKDNPAMHGFHSSIVFLDAWRKSIRNFDVDKAYEGMRKNATEATMLPWRNGPKTILDDFYREHGFFPALKPSEAETVPEVHSFEKRQSVAITLAHSYDDWALGQMAKELGKEIDYNYFNKEAANYRNLYQPETRLMMPKDADGNWIEIDPKFDGGSGGRDYYDENNGYTYQWNVQHDIHGLIDLMGGRKAFSQTLDQLFRENLGRTKYQFWAKFPDATGLVGQYSMGNEPSFHIPYLYNFAGEPWKTQKRIRFLLDVWFKDNIFGIPGDEDGGAMTAFVVFSAMGFYPATPGIPVYTLGSPQFEEIKINLENGNVFTLKAYNCSERNKYIQSAKLNGKPLKRTWFTHEDLMNGATIELEMGSKPNKNWGTEISAAPPSKLEITN
ncbi:alpha-1,2-mannosidase, putative [Mariniphaga anaerophila]|uniref:Alpha-1,2-mannosidase, putative n=1 Tax=Mariniphaga anaerophila TaxID=1484053 RepID=A0A1M4ZZW5_9BACT|nr:GH92 family glycosyl hydrolase [Mariniphaga anaerophila]SHF23590.1 alpha-1,2-mannosidase, putative [Mariniphaga anaerophila]